MEAAEKKQMRSSLKEAKRAAKAESRDTPDPAEVEETIRTSILNFRRRRNG